MTRLGDELESVIVKHVQQPGPRCSICKLPDELRDKAMALIDRGQSRRAVAAAVIEVLDRNGLHELKKGVGLQQMSKHWKEHYVGRSPAK